jgi:hypothetical protein
MPIVLSPGLQKLNQGISNLMARTAPPSQPVTMLYDRWVRFLQTPSYAMLPDAALWPIYRAFAATYVVVARLEGIQPADVDASLLALAGYDAQRNLNQVGASLDKALNVAVDGTKRVGGALFGPAALVIGVLVAFGYARRGGFRGR